MRNLLPAEAWALLQATPDALFVDVRMEIESLYVGRPPGVHMIAWYEYPELTPDPHAFVAAVKREIQGDSDAERLARTVILICRSGKRSSDAGRALEAAGFNNVVNVLHGFEGDLDTDFHRSRLNGWRHDGLPWEQM